MTWLDFIALILAAGAVVDVWRNGSLFEEVRAWMEARADYSENEAEYQPESSSEPFDETYPADPTPLWMRVGDRIVPRWLAELLNCWFCFSHHTPWVLVLVLFLPSLYLAEPWSLLVKLPLYCLAATRAGNILNSMLPEDQRYNRSEAD